MKILYLHPQSWSGKYGMLTKLKNLGHDVCVLEEWRGARDDVASRPARRFTPDFILQRM